ncbi:MAG TPA: penicillin-binding protein 2, partial [Rhodospirillales bacterium]|nr:penicillin-binding protein 2 [Rhodospirillales bacterium]
RLYYLQVIERDRYLTLAEDNRINLRLMAPTRGRILDRLGRPLALNRQEFRLVVTAEQAPDMNRTLELVSLLLPLSESDRKRVLREIGRQRRFVPVTIRDDLGWEDVARIEVNALDLPGVAVEEGQSREYPYGDSLSHVLGYVGPVAEADAADGDPLLQLPGFRVGKAGIEKRYETPLRGVGGSSQVEVNAVGRVIRELDRQEGESGAELTLALDLDLQQLAVQRLGEESGAAVVLDIETGEVLAMASTPAYDPAAFNRGLTAEEWKALTTNPKAPLTNKAIAGQYAPGSTFKPVVALAALDRGVMNAATRVFCPGDLRIGNAVFHCWRRGGHGSLALRDALAQSCDCYFYEAARRAGVDRIAAMGRRLGLGVPLGIDLPHERGGLLPTPDWKMATRGKSWSVGETVITGIGQGYVLSTPLQLAMMSARIANGKVAPVPRLVRDASVAESVGLQESAIDLGLNPAHLKVVQDGLNAVVNSARGTAKGAAIRVPGMEMAGKTGTSQVRRISMAERKSGVIRNEHLPWERRDHALFVGYAPVAAPRYAVAVVIEHGGAGSKAAAPVARDILLAAQKLDAQRIAEGRQRRSGAAGG